ncbi:NADPH-dependent FMN reductase [Streptomyces canus]|uniref:NADPH-dependent FMN reductase n=1 Tax=Streptomyces canus TaxID=58343 RepID=UPI002E2ACF75|nr:NADPH-dependent FMN reductase [Streptomyces canus]
MEILIIQGSLGNPSRTAALAELSARTLAREGHRVRLFDLRVHDLPWAVPYGEEESWSRSSPSLRELIRAAAAADAFVWASPVYHNSYSGVLKCALDHLTEREFRDKPVALCGDGGRRGSEQPLEHLRTVARSLHACATSVVVASRADDFTLKDGQYVVTNQEITVRVGEMCRQLAAFAELLRGSAGAVLRSAQRAEELA